MKLSICLTTVCLIHSVRQARGNANIDEKLITLREKINNVTEFFHDDWNNAVIIVEETLAKMDKSYMNNFDKVLYDLSKHRIQSALSPDQQQSWECKDADKSLKSLRRKVKGTSTYCQENILKFQSDPELKKSYDAFIRYRKHFLKSLDDKISSCEEKYCDEEMQLNDCYIGVIVAGHEHLNAYFQSGNDFRRDLTIKQRLIERQSAVCYQNLERNFKGLSGEIGERTREVLTLIDRCINGA